MEALLIEKNGGRSEDPLQNWRRAQSTEVKTINVDIGPEERMVLENGIFKAVAPVGQKGLEKALETAIINFEQAMWGYGWKIYLEGELYLCNFLRERMR